ncbi:glycosyltransferase family 4 protein [Jinshanibacter sp. LJY008]|uniref:Glycosyltransferase family 4 protein n=1 Tax=Limnobaculum eriocheiris TaxID=2897391 RepID=A0A9X1SIU4_9GAMM|nr:glycosyltransferase family 4 protein [Limnobaculum eriocheiris]MCD1124788.1 glycosyltransferase family 4 protein [Limnobaculum eriocheiris]
MKKILFYLNSMKPAGGIERVVSTIVGKLSSSYEITILVKDDGDSFYAISDNVKLVSMNNPLILNMNNRLFRIFQIGKSVFTSVKFLRSFIHNNRYDYIYITHPMNHVEYLLAGGNTDKLIISEHGSSHGYNFFYRIIKRLTYKSCLFYCIPTKQDYNLYMSKGFPAVYIPHFRSDMVFSLNNKKEKIVLNVGRFTADKQQLVLLYCWNQLVIRGLLPDGWTLIIIGEGELENELLKFIKDNQLNSVTLLRTLTRIESIYSKVSIFALTSRFEGFGMVLLEAISFGVPCVSFDCPSGPRDIIEDGYNGFLAELNNVEEYIDKLSILLKESDLREEMGRNALIKAEEWNDNIILQHWFKVFK